MKVLQINILNKLRREISTLAKWYKKLYKIQLTESVHILEYWENEFFGWKAEAYEDILELIKKYELTIKI